MRKGRFSNPEIEEPGRIRIQHQEGGIICSLEQTVSGSCDGLNRLVRDTVSDLARWTGEQGGLVGHIKAALQTPEGTWFYSCTGDAVHVRQSPDPGTQLAFTAIVFFVDEEQLKLRLERFLQLLQDP